MTKKAETLKMAEMYRNGLLLQTIGERYGISKQGVQQRLARFGITAKDRPLKYAPIDRERLADLYARNISFEKIADELGTNADKITKALRFYKIPKRKRVKAGPRADIFRTLGIGDKYVETLNCKQPYVLAYMSAKKVGIKVSTRRLGDKLEITRIE